MTLSFRIQRYLKAKNDWVREDVIQALARREGYTWEDTREALKEVVSKAPYASIYKGGSAYYRWYDMPQEEIDRINKNNEDW